MSPTMNKLGLLSFATTALAAPWSYAGYGHHHHLHPSGSGTSYASGTGKPYPAGNGTGPYGSGTAASTGFAYSTGYLTVTKVITEGASTPSVDAAGYSTSSSCSTPTVSTTTTAVLTVTVSPSAANQLPSGYQASSNAFWSVPSISTPSDYPSASSLIAAAVPSSPVSAPAPPAPPAPPAYSSNSAPAADHTHSHFSMPWKQHSSVEVPSESSTTPVSTPITTSSTPAAPVETSSATPTSYSTPELLPTSYSMPAVIPTSYNIPAAAAPSYNSPAAAASSSSTTAAAAASTPSSSYSGSTSGTKRGLPYNDASLTDCFAGSKVSWAYNWGSSSDGLDTSKFEYVPQLWSGSSSFLTNWESDVKTALGSGSKYILGFNEPDLSSQANMQPGDAATAYKSYITDLFGSSGVTLGSPAVTNGGGDMGLTWLSSFLGSCSDCNIGFVALHWYDSYANTDYFKQHITQAHEQTGLPVWVTEFGTTDGSDEQISGFLEEVMPWMDEQSFVERYAYFMASDGKLNSGSEMSSYGSTYATYE